MRHRYYLVLILVCCGTSALLAQLSVTLPAEFVSCQSEAVALTGAVVTDGTPPYTYAWSPAAGLSDPTAASPTAQPGETTIYTLQVTDALGAVATAETVVEVTQIFAVIQSFACLPEYVAITITGSNIGGAIRIADVFGNVYFVTPGQLTEIGPFPPGNQLITIHDLSSTCSIAENFTILSTSLEVDVTTTPAFCGNDNGTATASATGGTPPYTYAWSNGAATATINNLAPGTYTVTVTDANNCIGTRSATINNIVGLIASAGSDRTICQGGSATLVATGTGGTAPFTFLWSNGVTTASTTFTPATTATYTVTVTDATGCTSTDQVVVTVRPTPTLSIVKTDATCGASNGTATASAAGGTSPYSYLWSTGYFGATATNLTARSYTITVTDANGCQDSQSFEIANHPTARIQTTGVLNCATGTALLDASASTAGGNIRYEWTGPMGTIITDAPQYTATEVGEYTLRVVVTDQADCSATATVSISELGVDFGEGIATQLLGCNLYRLSGIVPPNYFGLIEFLWTFPDGSTSNALSITPDQTGVYTLVTSAPGLECTFYSTTFVDVEAQACAVIRGYVRADNNDNCIADVTESGIPGVVVAATDGTTTYHALTQADGSFSFSLPTGSYTVTYTLPSSSWEVCQAAYTASVPAAGDVATLAIPVRRVVDCPELEVQLSSNLLRRCFDNYYYINVTNHGTVVAVAPQVMLLLDDFLTYQSSLFQPTVVDGQTIIWTLADLPPGATRQFWVRVYVGCDALLGQTHCSEVTATPDPLCTPAAGWSGANLTLDGNCDGSDVVFTIRNAGAAPMMETAQFIVIEDGVAMMQAPESVGDLGVGEEVTRTFPANGSTYTFILDQVTNHPYAPWLATSVEGCGLNDQNSFSTGFVAQVPQATATPASDVFCTDNIGAYDPNDKSAVPLGYRDAHYILPETELQYRIRFQNTGTDTAFTIVIRDTLSAWLDVRTLMLGNSSHRFTADLSGERVLTFTFNNILLPDSTTNLAASQGFVDFNIRPHAETPLETRIENSAGIYFDFNEPIITNTVFHTLGRDFWEVISLTTAPHSGLDVRVFPNPAQDILRIAITGNTAPTLLRVVLLDAVGQTVRRATFQTPATDIDVTGLPNGMYWVQLTTPQGQVLAFGKVVVGR